MHVLICLLIVIHGVIHGVCAGRLGKKNITIFYSIVKLNRLEDKIKCKYKGIPNLVNNTNSSVRLPFKTKK